MPNKIKIGYVIYNDRPNSGLIRNQVFSVLCEIQKQGVSFDITVVAIWHPLIYVKYKKYLDDTRKKLLADGVVLENWPIAPFPNRFFLYNRYALPVLYFFLIHIFRFLVLSRFDIVHSRSYFPSLIVASLKKYYDYKYKCIFDMRSLFPEEYITVGKWNINSPIYGLWKGYERFTVSNSDEFIAVSAAMKTEADKIISGRESRLITLAVDTIKLSFDQVARSRIRQQMGWDQKFVVAYQGSLGFDSLWNNINNYMEYFSRMLGVRDGLHMLLVTPVVSPMFWEAVDKYGIDRNKITFVDGPENLSEWLSASDAGIHVMSPGPDGHTRLGVKVVEYLSCGLPVITNSNVGAAADFVESHDVGIRLDLGDDFGMQLSKFLDASYSRGRLSDIARENFSIGRIAGSYANLYMRMLNPVQLLPVAS
jgi:glycosyltransferase involved in cell wall biosynthesis